MNAPAAEARPRTKIRKPAIVLGQGTELSWQEEMRAAIRCGAELRAAVGLPAAAKEPQTNFPLLAPWPMVRRIEKGNPRDPILLQLLHSFEELAPQPGYSADPLQEQGSSPAPGVIHKYKGRALLIATAACALHCRYCFRREFPYAEHSAGRLREALAYLRADASLREVILSGGDPLSLDDDRLIDLIAELESIPHLRTLRIHTRLPIAIPQRLTARLLKRLEHSRFQVIVVVHSNHARELDLAVQSALLRLAKVATVLNQAVLLRNINDTLTAQVALSEALFAARTLPYYLNQLDPVSGAHHFAVPDEHAQALIAALRTELPGYLVPKLVREIPGSSHKVPV